jgi:hypothetical protein
MLPHAAFFSQHDKEFSADGVHEPPPRTSRHSVQTVKDTQSAGSMQASTGTGQVRNPSPTCHDKVWNALSYNILPCALMDMRAFQDAAVHARVGVHVLVAKYLC